MSSTTSFKAKNPFTREWRLCGDHAQRRAAACDLLSLESHIMNCEVLPALIQIPGWEDLVSFDGTYTTQGYFSQPVLVSGRIEAVPFANYQARTQRRFSLNALSETYLLPLREHFKSELLDGTHLCFSTFHQFYERFDTIPSELDVPLENAQQLITERCMGIRRGYLEATFRLLLPQSAPSGKRCKTFEDTPYDSTTWIDGRYMGERNISRGRELFRGFYVWAVGIATSLAASTCFLFAAFRRRAARRSAKSPQVLPFSRRTLLKSRTLQFIGQGGESEVYLSEIVLALGEKKHIATKMFYKASTAKAEISFYERLPRHDNILSVHGCYYNSRAKRHCLAMTLCKHDNLRESMITKAFPRHGPFVHRTLSGVIGALGAMHANGMAHGDLKLDNVLLSCECAGDAECACLRTHSPSVCAKLSDFAMARQGTLMGVSSANLKGTMMYVPPERVEYDPANHQADFYCRGDVYALGLMTWEMLHFLHSGEVVSCAEAILPGVRNPQDVLIEISKGKFVPPCEFLPEPVQRYLRKCWHFKPAKRFKDAREARRVWEKIRADVHAVADKSQILQSSIGSSSKGTDAALLGSTASTNRDLTGVTTTTASPVRSSV
jgi:serine/threonine protein kinase